MSASTVKEDLHKNDFFTSQSPGPLTY